jgi:hypothetical protein
LNFFLECIYIYLSLKIRFNRYQNKKVIFRQSKPRKEKKVINLIKTNTHLTHNPSISINYEELKKKKMELTHETCLSSLHVSF